LPGQPFGIALAGRRRLLLGIVAFLALIGAAPASAEKRVALVVGNSAYRNVTRLDNPANDAKLMAETLRGLGFTLIGGSAQIDLDKPGIDRVVQAFGAQLRSAEVGLFYYAGHGVQVRGANYLVPVDANPTSEADVDFQMLDTNLVLRQMEVAGTKLNLVILDACRNNPFGGRGLRATTGGLAQMQAPEGTLISYATQPGNVAHDGTDGNSPYTKALAQTIRRAGLGIFDAFNEVGLAVKQATGGAQQPWVSSSPIAGSFYFAGLPQVPDTRSQAVSQPPVDERAIELALWNAIQGSSDPTSFEDFLKKFPNGVFAGAARARLDALKPKAAALPPPATVPTAGSSPTLAAVKKRGILLCGTSGALPGFSLVDVNGVFTGLDVDFCRALAAAIFNDPSKVKYVALTAKDRFTALQTGEIDVLARNTTKTASREASLGLRFGAVNFYDGQAFMVRKSLLVKSALELNGAAVCVQLGTTTDANLADYFRSNKMKLTSVTFAQFDDAVNAYDAARCDALTTDRSMLYFTRVRLAKPDDHMILPERISDEPLAPAVRQGDEQWLSIVTWVHYAMVNAEQLEITQANVEAAKQSTNPAIRRLIGAEGAFGESLGLTNDWAYRIVKGVGSYAEAFDRSFGQKSALKMDRGPNALVSQGGQQQSPAIR
jgi:general L-amino acid transport system substrate-binding protein